MSLGAFGTGNPLKLRTVVFGRLRKQLAERGACAPDATVKLCLACGRIATKADREGLHKHFAEKGWASSQWKFRLGLREKWAAIVCPS